MVTTSRTRNTQVFGAVADPTRRAILDLLRRGELPAGELARRFTVSRPAVSRHLRVLKDAGLIHEARRSQSRLYSLNAAPLAEVDQWLSNYRLFWAARLHDLKQFVESDGEARRDAAVPADRKELRT